MIVISSGHGKYIRGAEGLIDEVNEARKVVPLVAAFLRAHGEQVIEFHDNTSTTQDENLDTIIDFHNSMDRDLDVSVHFNAYEPTPDPRGTEVWFSTQAELAAAVSEAIAEAGMLIDRGAKQSDSLAFLNRTDKPAILIEVCFVDSVEDVDHYHDHFREICGGIAKAISDDAVSI